MLWVPAPCQAPWVLPAPTLLYGCCHGSGGADLAPALPQFPPEPLSPQAQPVLTDQMAAGVLCVWVSGARVLRAVKLLPWKLPMDKD